MAERDLSTSRTRVFGPLPEKGTHCRVCERDVDDGRACYCSDYCREIATAVMNLLNWGSVRDRIVDRDDKICQVCGFDASWLDKGDDHIRDIVESQLPDRPEYPTLEEIGAGEAREEALDEYTKAATERCEKREELEDRYGNWRVRYRHLEVDHIEPVSEGGHPFDPANLRTLCSDCHQEKTAAEAADRAERREDARPADELDLLQFGGTS